MATGSLRRRLTLTCLAVLCLALSGFDVFLYASFANRLDGDLNTALVDRAGLARRLDGQLTAQELADRLAGAGVSATVRRAGATYVGRPQAPPAAPAGPRPALPTPPRGTPRDVVRHGATLTLTETLGDGTLVLRSDRRSADAELRRLLALEVAGSLLVLALAAIALTLLVRRAVAPLDRMTRVAASIASGHGGQRLRPERTDTELGRMAGAFDAMLDSLEASNARARESEERMREFLGDISHELRTPVTGLVASAERLLREGAVEDPEHERLLVAMVRQSGRAGRLIDDLLTLGRLQAGDALAVGEVDLAHVAREEAARTRLLAPGVTVGVAGTPRLPVRGDGDRIAQVLANLLDNARHAVGVAGAIQVTLAAEAGLARVEVRDDGPGVPEADRERIFERLVRLDPSRSRVSFGSGLGLSIAREIARAHGGELVCAEHPGGARFVLTLPSAGPVGAGEPPTPSGVSLKLG